MGKHSSSVCEFGGQLYIAYYQGVCEGWSQEVVVLRKDKFGGKPTKILSLEGGYGNPVIFEHNGQLILACTKFRNEVKNITNVNVLWTHADTLINSVDGWQNNGQHNTLFPYLNTRAAPLVCGKGDSDTLLPCYDEMAGGCAVMRLSGGKDKNYELNRGLCWSFPDKNVKAIQPSGILRPPEWLFIMRNHAFAYQPGHKPITPVCVFNLISHKFTFGMNDEIPQHNESAILFANPLDGNEPWVIFNAEAYRQSLTIAPLADPKSDKQKMVLNAIPGKGGRVWGYASYPNCCAINNGQELVVCCTVSKDKTKGFDGNQIRLVKISKNESPEVDDLTGEY
jgi:hypothetical protein